MGSGSTHMPLGGQIAIVTGGGRGIGEGIAKRLSQDGATVEVFDLDGEVSVDLTDERAVAAGVRGVLNRHGRVDILVNNAGIFPHTPFEELDLTEWRRVFAVNLDAMFLCAHAVYPGMKESHYGRIVNISSAAFFVGDPVWCTTPRPREVSSDSRERWQKVRGSMELRSMPSLQGSSKLQGC